ncbi:hypothetical protein HQ447_00630 [bacterium]|nr:hypothetical protein [bacterium]
MKLRTIFFTALLGLGPCLTQAESGDFISELKQTDENGGSMAALEKWHQLSLDQQALAIDAIIQKVQTVGDDARSVKFNSTDYVSSAAWFLAQVGTDEQIVAAFGNLSGFGNVEPDAAQALASCKSTAGVEIIEKLGEKRLPELEPAINPKNEEERARVNAVLIPFYFLIIRLEGATNPEGSRAAKRLRDQVAARYPSGYGKIFVATLDEEMAKTRTRIKKETSTPEPLPSQSNSAPAKVLNATRSNANNPAQTRSQEGTGISAPSKVAAIIAFILAGTALAWRFMRKRDSSPMG